MPTRPNQDWLPATFWASPGHWQHRGRTCRLQRIPKRSYRPLGPRVIWGMSDKWSHRREQEKGTQLRMGPSVACKNIINSVNYRCTILARIFNVLGA